MGTIHSRQKSQAKTPRSRREGTGNGCTVPRTTAGEGAREGQLLLPVGRLSPYPPEVERWGWGTGEEGRAGWKRREVGRKGEDGGRERRTT